MVASSRARAIDRALLCANRDGARHLAGHVPLAQPRERRFAAGVYAATGCDAALALAADAQLLGCRSHADAAAYFAASEPPEAGDQLAAGAILAWSGDAPGVYALTAAARDAALREGRLGFAVAAAERLAFHARLFGDLEVARTAAEEALALATARGLPAWRTLCLSAAAALALDLDDLDRAASLLGDAMARQPAGDDLAALAPVACAYALLAGDAAGIARWSSPAALAIALSTRRPWAAVAATSACLAAAAASPAPGTPLALAVRRALAGIEDPLSAIEFLGLVSRWGSLDDARLAVDRLRAVFAPNRRYVEAHWLLARAQLRLREGDRSGAIDSAGDAARAFDAIGLRHWTNEAMLLLVRHEGAPDSAQRRRPSAISLTRREQQVAHLIRRGASNREVARTLQISEHTVERHVSSILSRLGLRSRWQIVDAPLSAGIEG